MYISAAEFNMIASAISFAAERVMESKGEIGVFTDDPNENVLDAQTALKLVERMNEADVWRYDWVLLADSPAGDLLSGDNCLNVINELFYDDYGRLRKAAGMIPTIDAWIAETKRTHAVCLDVFPADEIERAHDILGDLWLDNERAGDNNPDGTFNTRK